MNRSEPSSLAQTSALLLSVGILVLGNGLQGTLIGVRAGLEGMAQESIGIVMSAYFVGFAIGSVLSPQLIARVGHIRTFAALASIASAVALAYLIVIAPPAWAALRMLHGACYAGLIVVAESWLNAMTPRSHRGRVLALYNIVLVAAWVASQPLLNLASPSGFLLFFVVSICLSLAPVPITLCRAGVPGVVAASRSSLRRLYEISPIGVVGAFMVGIWTSAFWGMGPTFAQSIGLGNAGISAFMAVTMAGALVVQWPLGWLSDRLDRRLVIVGTCLLGGGVALVLAWMVDRGLPVLLGLSFAFGGFSITVYSICVAHVNDNIEQEELVAAASGLILVYGVGSISGPFAASLLMERLGPPGLFLFAGCAQTAYVIFGAFRMARRPAVAAQRKEAFVTVPGTTHAALPLHRHGAGKAEGEAAPE